MSIRELPVELKAVAKRDLGEDEDRLEEHIEHIREWLKKQPHINANTDSQWIAAFLRGCKHSIERTKEKLDAYYTIRTHLPELFTDRDPKNPKIIELLDLGIYLPLPKTADPDSPRVIILRGGSYDPSKHTFLDIMRVNYMIMDLMLLEDDRSTIVGQQTILDLVGSRFEHVAQFTPATVKKAVMSFQDAYPLRTKSMHFINLPPSFDMVFNVFRLFLTEKLKNRIMTHADTSTLYKHVPQEILPSDHGGKGPSVAELTAYWKKKALDNRDWFLEDAKFRVDESKRPGKPVTGADLFGVDGSFKQLSID